jgi:phosphoglycerate kinase
MKSLKEAKDLRGKKVIVRADFNVPVTDKGKVMDMFRINVCLPTIAYLQKKGARIILVSHIGREPGESLKPVYTVLKKHVPLKFIPEILSENVNSTISEMKNGDIVMLENLRSNPGEKGCNKDFAKSLAKLGDVYVNEAFPVSHRADASIVLLPKLLPAYAGFQMEKEVKELSKVLKPKHPFVFIQGGAKAETKIPLLKKFLKSADCVYIGGELANDFYKSKGYEIGKSNFDKVTPPLGSYLKNKRLVLPESVVVLRDGKNITTGAHEVQKNDFIYDIGLPSIHILSVILEKAKLILWNGPLGWYENGYIKGTEELLKILASSKAETIIGGGDTAVLVDRKKMSDKFTFVSTGGGATLEFLAKGTLVGIKALK